MIRSEYFILLVLLLVRFQVLRTIASAGIPSSNYFLTCISFVIEKFFNNQFLLRFNRATSMDKKMPHGKETIHLCQGEKLIRQPIYTTLVRYAFLD